MGLCSLQRVGRRRTGAADRRSTTRFQPAWPDAGTWTHFSAAEHDTTAIAPTDNRLASSAGAIGAADGPAAAAGGVWRRQSSILGADRSGRQRARSNAEHAA